MRFFTLTKSILVVAPLLALFFVSCGGSKKEEVAAAPSPPPLPPLIVLIAQEIQEDIPSGSSVSVQGVEGADKDSLEAWLVQKGYSIQAPEAAEAATPPSAITLFFSKEPWTQDHFRYTLAVKDSSGSLLGLTRSYEYITPADQEALIAKKLENCMSRQSDSIFCDTRNYEWYPLVKIDKQIWFGKNLTYDAPGSYCWQDNNNYCIAFGRRYKLEQSQKACPIGWHLPNEEDFEALRSFLYGQGKNAGALKGVGVWPDGKGTDDYQFNALPIPFTFTNPNSGWVNTSYESWFLKTNGSFFLINGQDYIYGGTNAKAESFIRCLKDAP
jgi:uncharacterized protein (TIGR02145 family)